MKNRYYPMQPFFVAIIEGDCGKPILTSTFAYSINSFGKRNDIKIFFDEF